jgi:transketolase
MVNDAIGKAQSVYGQPSVIITHTVAAKGVDVFERDFRWHGNPPGKGPEDRVPRDEQSVAALEKLKTLDGAIVPSDS